MNDARSPQPLVCRAVSVRYGDRPALHEVSLSVGRGELVALAGPNGSGKTTLLRATLGMLPLSHGSIELFGRSTVELSTVERARAVAWVPQSETPRDNVRLYDYVLYGRYPFHGPLEGDSRDDHTIARRVLDEVGLSDRAEDGVLSLSGGERQRATLARALAQTTPLVLLDEPTSHLDIAHQLDLLGRVRVLSRDRGVAVVAAIHDLNLAARFADRIVVLSHGRLVADGAPAQVLSVELLARVWGISADLRRDPRTGSPYLLPQQLLSDIGPPTGARSWGPVHVVGGGGAASPFLRALAEEGYRVSTGAVPLLDSDAETAEALALPAAVEVPFAPLGTEARNRHRALLSAARAIVVAPFAVGPANLANLEDVRPFVPGTPTFLVARPPVVERDFCGGSAAAAYEELRTAGAVEVEDLPALLGAVRSLSERSAAPA